MTMNWNELKKRIMTPMKFKVGDRVEWQEILSCCAPWRLTGIYKGNINGVAKVRLRSGAIVDVKKEKLRYADE